ncbi:MAG: hypothetical protein DWH79_09830 [Planctomycetota bacterium]|nr:MAG: hypothetical protein DWH79_09830 [Planctomycetota bacterium]
MPSSSSDRPAGRKPRPPQLIASGRILIRFVSNADRWGHAVEIDAVECLEDSVRPNAPQADPTLSVPKVIRWESVEGPGDDGDDPRWPASPVMTEIHRMGAGISSPLVGIGLAGRSHFSASITPDPDRPGAIRVDVATRLHEPPRWLGSTYRCLAIPRDLKLVRIVPAIPLPAQLPCTVQWSYRLSLDGIEPLAGTRLEEAGDRRG